MARRLPSTPPTLPGFSYLHVLGTGGFADVFLYEQNMPRRQVAVKVLLSEVVDDQVRQMFQAEATLMAQLGANPAVLTIYDADVSADGRPYLVMEFCSSALNERYRRERIPVAEVLRIAIKIGSALEAVHRAGVLHRDVKPSNILTTQYGHPVLADFGIAATLQNARDEEAVGLSIPWSAPEVLIDDVPGTIASEVWSFAATVYSLLAGRSPFEVPGGDNSAAELMSRIGRARPAAVDRPDAPPSLEALLRRGMSRRPEHRPRSLLEFVRELQAIESELGLPPTAVELVADDWASSAVAELEERTRLRPVSSGEPLSRAERRRRARAALTADEPMAVVAGSHAPRGGSVTAAAASSRQRVMAAMIAVTAALAVVLGTVALIVLVANSSNAIPGVGEISAETGAAGTVTFTWDDPGLDEGDRYQIEVRDGTSSIQLAPRFVVDADAGETVCVSVSVNRAGSNGPASPEKCVDVLGG